MHESPQELAERVARLEARDEARAAQLETIDRKLDQLITAATMGKGAWRLILIIGSAVAGLATLIIAANALITLFRHGT